MKCPECIESGQKSHVHGAFQSSTLLGWPGQYYDENGILHSHDPNTVTRVWDCTNGHQFATKRIPECPADGCNYGGQL